MSRLPIVLVVENNRGDTLLIEEAFRDCSVKVELHEAENAAQAFDYLGIAAREGIAWLPSIIILDLNLPIFSGYDVLRGLKEDAKLKDIPVVVFTSSYEESDRRACLEMGADEFISKPLGLAGFRVAVMGIKRKYVGCCHPEDCLLANPA